MGTHTYGEADYFILGRQVHVTVTTFTTHPGSPLWDVYVDGECITDESIDFRPSEGDLKDLIIDAVTNGIIPTITAT